MNPDGDWIFDLGPTPNADLGKGTFDAFDKVVFLARDAGDRVAREAWTSGSWRPSPCPVDGFHPFQFKPTR